MQKEKHPKGLPYTDSINQPTFPLYYAPYPFLYVEDENHHQRTLE